MSAETLSRRRALTVLALGAGAAALGGGAPLAEEEWRGTALGAEAHLLFAASSGVERRRAVAEVLAEVERLEAVFSLQQAGSDLSRLNAAGHLTHPPADLVVLLRLCARLHRLTNKLFDPTVQPLWRRFVEWHAREPAREAPPESFIAQARRCVGFARVEIDGSEIALPDGAALTLNGVAQGYITDRVAERLRALGFRHVLVEMGEIRALDGRTAHSPWRVAVPGVPDPVPLHGTAIATSAGNATRIGTGGDHHIFDPRTGRPSRQWASLSVRHASATVADALSTGLSCAGAAEIRSVLTKVPGATAWAHGAAGLITFAGGAVEF